MIVIHLDGERDFFVCSKCAKMAGTMAVAGTLLSSMTSDMMYLGPPCRNRAGRGVDGRAHPPRVSPVRGAAVGERLGYVARNVRHRVPRAIGGGLLCEQVAERALLLARPLLSGMWGGERERELNE